MTHERTFALAVPKGVRDHVFDEEIVSYAKERLFPETPSTAIQASWAEGPDENTDLLVLVGPSAEPS